jgi:hypothetical protein
MTVEQVRKGELLIQLIIENEERVEQLEKLIKNMDTIHFQYEWVTIRDLPCYIDYKVALDLLKSQLDRELKQLEEKRRELFEL